LLRRDPVTALKTYGESDIYAFSLEVAVMPFLIIVRFLFSLVSWGVLAAAGWLLWEWYDGALVMGEDGLLRRVREDWQLWLGAGLLAWSFVGGFILRPLLAKPDRRTLDAHHGDGEIIEGARGAKLYVEQLGPQNAPCLILTHGWGLDSTIWAYAKSELAKDFRVVVWDLPGMGRSRAGPDGVHLSAFAEDLARVIAWTGRDKVVLASHSIGGMTTQTLARDNPTFFKDRVAGAVLINTSYTNPLKTMVLSGLAQALRPLIELQLRLTAWLEPLAFISAWQSYFSGAAHVANRLGFGPHVTHSQLTKTALLTTRNSQRAQALGNLSMFRWDATGVFADIDVPVLVLGGRQDIVTKAEASRTIAASALDGRLEVIDEANHMGFLEHPEAYNRAIATFAGSLVRSMPEPVVKVGGRKASPAQVRETERLH
jgi:pimeloyl-ACP methyl ester carboxylesterase